MAEPSERQKVDFGDLRGLEAGEIVYLDNLAFMIMDSRPSMEVVEYRFPDPSLKTLEIDLHLKRCPSMDRTGE